MILNFRPIKVWPEGWQAGNRKRTSSPFSASYASTLELLDRELRNLNAIGATLQVDATERDVRLDGQLRHDAKVRHPGVILSIDTKRHGTLIYATDAFEGYRGRPSWQENLRAIALGLEALRAVNRYGIAERGQQYAGYRELGTGIELGRAKMTLEEAARFLIEFGEWGGPDGADQTLEAILDADPEVIAAYFRVAVKKLHPDTGGDPELFRKLTEARELLEGRLS